KLQVRPAIRRRFRSPFHAALRLDERLQLERSGRHRKQLRNGPFRSELRVLSNAAINFETPGAPRVFPAFFLALWGGVADSAARRSEKRRVIDSVLQARQFAKRSVRAKLL